MVGYAGAAAFGRIARPRLAASGRNPAAARAPWYRLAGFGGTRNPGKDKTNAVNAIKGNTP